jgi:ADP-ribosyl-[dinitrogen reductase] hydrolase
MNSASDEVRDRIMGSIVGGAIGDALGGVKERGSLSVSDDTQLTLATCEAIIAAREVSPAAIAQQFADEFSRGQFTGLGSSTLKALRDLQVGAHWALSGARGERAAGNGAAMRIAPLAFILDPLVASHRTVIRDICRITHHSDEAYCGALAVLLAIRVATSSDWQDHPATLRQIANPLPDSHVKDRLVLMSDLPTDEPVGKIAATFGSSGFVGETVPLAIATAMKMTTDGIEPVMVELSKLNGDIDTVGSIAGQIAGAFLRFSGLPPALVKLLPNSATIVDTANRFATAVVDGSIRVQKRTAKE